MAEEGADGLAFRFFAGTERAELADALVVRQAVFVEEQGIAPELELDEYDYIAWHAVAAEAGQPIATARFVTLDVHTGKIGRVAVLPAYRRRGIASHLMALITEYARREGMTRLVLDAQISAMGLYRKQGFEPEGEPFLDAGIVHMRMAKDLRRGG